MQDPGSDPLTTEGRLGASRELDLLSSLELVRLMNEQDRRVVEVVAAQGVAIARVVDRIVACLEQGGRLIYGGAGTSGRLCVLDAAECPPTFGAAPGQVVGLIAGGREALVQAVEGAEDDPELARQDLLALGTCPQDVVVGITASGRTPYVLGLLSCAAERGATGIAITCNSPSPAAQLALLSIPLVVGPEVVSGSTRLKAGTATKMVLNMLSTGAFVQLGKTHGDLMVDVVASNRKLHARCRRIVALATDLSEEEAALWLQRCDGEVKTAIVAASRSIAPEEARRLLHSCRGRVRAAIAHQP